MVEANTRRREGGMGEVVRNFPSMWEKEKSEERAPCDGGFYHKNVDSSILLQSKMSFSIKIMKKNTYKEMERKCC